MRELEKLIKLAFEEGRDVGWGEACADRAGVTPEHKPGEAYAEFLTLNKTAIETLDQETIKNSQTQLLEELVAQAKAEFLDAQERNQQGHPNSYLAKNVSRSKYTFEWLVARAKERSRQ